MRSPRGSFLPSFLLVTLGLLLVGVHVLRPKAQTTEETSTPCCGQADTTAPRQLEFPYYSLRDGFNSTLLLVSDSPKPLDFVLAVHSRSGQTLLAPGMTIQPQEKLTVDLATLLASLSADVTGDFAEGSVSIYFNGTFMPLAGQLTMTNPARRLILESEMVDNSPGLGLLPPVLNAVWWGLGGGREAKITVSNTSGDTVTADVFLDFQGERHPSAALVFSAHETKVLSVTQMLGNLKVSPAQAPEGGITIIQRGPKPSLVAQGRITDSTTGFSTSLNFADPSLQRASALHASGVPIGLPSKDSPFAGTGVFIPHVIVRNLSGSAQTATITIEYPGEKGPQQTALPPLALGPYSTEDVSLDSAFGLLPLPVPYSSIRIQYSGLPGSAIAEVSSVESNGDLVIDSRVANEGDGWAGSGAHPWHLDDETESVLFLTNMSDLEARIGFQVQAGGVHYYLTDLKLNPRETRAIDMRKLRDAQVADFQGNLIPAAATDGSVLWIRLDNVPVMGRLVVLQRHKGVASNYDCFTCQCPASLMSQGIMTPASLNLLVSTTGQDTATGKYYDCNSNYSYSNLTSTATWSPTSNPVAWVNNSTSKGLVSGVSGGSQSISFSSTGTVYYPTGSGSCNSTPIVCTGSAPANVVVVSQSPSAFNMSTGDTKTITASVTPSTVAVNTSFTGKSPPTSNPDSSCAASLTIPGKSNVSGSIDHNVTASLAVCSGVFSNVRASATATAGSPTANSSNTTTVRIPPQVLIKMMEAEAGGTGNNTAMQSLGDVAQNRIYSSLFNPPYSNYQNTIVPGQFATSATTTGIQPQLDLSVNVFTGAAGRFCNSLAFWSPTLAQWQTVQTAINSGTTVFPGGTGAPTYSAWLTQNQQILHVSAVGTKTDGRPNFLYLAYRNPTQPAAVSTSCGP